MKEYYQASEFAQMFFNDFITVVEQMAEKDTPHE